MFFVFNYVPVPLSVLHLRVLHPRFPEKLKILACQTSRPYYILNEPGSTESSGVSGLCLFVFLFDLILNYIFSLCKAHLYRSFFICNIELSLWSGFQYKIKSKFFKGAVSSGFFLAYLTN